LVKKKKPRGKNRKENSVPKKLLPRGKTLRERKETYFFCVEKTAEERKGGLTSSHHIREENSGLLGLCRIVF